MELTFAVLVMGVGATWTVDVWAVVRQLLLGVPRPNYGHLGRWLGHMTRGQFLHKSIAAAAQYPGEAVIGWIAHYLIGIAFAALLLAVTGPGWLAVPTIGPALLFGIGTVLAPFLLMQPGMGAGIAAARAPRPAYTRLQSVLTHAVFGLGLYASAWLTH
ncbi:DUF2938 domain-containing protein [Massilia niabensis]|uniref:DUF2938 domain-containing protein n=1 Tax=Massilia niabensis TaxID=544910 RepID=A0ABW0L0Y0_9BURK